MSAIYAILCAALVYVAILVIFGQRIMYSRWAMALGFLSLAVSFAMLALITAGVFEQLQHAIITRAGFLGYGISLIVIIARYWLDAWNDRRNAHGRSKVERD